MNHRFVSDLDHHGRILWWTWWGDFIFFGTSWDCIDCLMATTGYSCCVGQQFVYVLVVSKTSSQHSWSSLAPPGLPKRQTNSNKKSCSLPSMTSIATQGIPSKKETWCLCPSKITIVIHQVIWIHNCCSNMWFHVLGRFHLGFFLGSSAATFAE